MLSFSVVGCGAAGNKAAIDLVKSGYKGDKVHLINSTDRDIENIGLDTIIFGQSKNTLGGCGKERSIGKQMLMADLQSGKVNVDHIVSDEDQAIVLVGATEGGSGSSSIPILAKYFHEVHGKNVILVLFFGFNDDVRGMRNSLELCQELSDEYTIISISNEKFLLSANENKFKAELLANALFVEVMHVLTGSYIKEGTQVMDDTDLYKATTTPGFMVAGTYRFKRPTTDVEFNKLFNTYIRTQGFVTPSVDPGAKRIAMMFDSPNDDDNVDYTGSVLRNNYGEPFEFFTHKNSNPSEYKISYIVSGMKMPSEEIKEIKNTYDEKTKQVDKSKDNFFGTNFLDTDDSGFDMMSGRKNTKVDDAKKDFFGSIEAPLKSKNLDEY